MRVIAFDIWGDYAHFRKLYTTSSPLTFSFPPPSTISGILGAIYGTDKNTNQYLDIFGPANCKTAIRILNPIKKVRIGINLLESKGTNLRVPMSDKNLAPRTQIRTEFIKDPMYRIYLAHTDDRVMGVLGEKLFKHEPVFSVSLGLSELLANFRLVGYSDYEIIADQKPVELCSPFTAENLMPAGLEVEIGKKYFKERMPILMDRNRVVSKYTDVIFEPAGKPIKARVFIYQKLETGENIAFF